MNNNEKATFAAGCFWCVQTAFQQFKGVNQVICGYSGGSVPFPNYQTVCAEESGHAESIQIDFDPECLPFTVLLDAFWYIHDPTSLNRQGNDVGTHYRSIIFYHDDKQRQLAEQSKNELAISKMITRPIVTEIIPFQAFYAAEGYHQNYYHNNPSMPYCQVNIKSKLQAFTATFQSRISKPND